MAFSFVAKSQKVDSIPSSKLDSLKKFYKKGFAKTYTSKPSQTVFVEAGGNSIIWSANYERRFSKRLDGFGFRVGIGYFPINNFNLISIPVGINILAGMKGNFLEMGLNATIVHSKYTKTISGVNPIASFGQIEFKDNQTQTLIGLPIGYRYQSVKNPFNFRIGVEPILGNRADGNAVFIVTGHLSLGYTF